MTPLEIDTHVLTHGSVPTPGCGMCGTGVWCYECKRMFGTLKSKRTHQQLDAHFD